MQGIQLLKNTQTLKLSHKINTITTTPFGGGFQKQQMFTMHMKQTFVFISSNYPMLMCFEPLI